MLSIVSLDGASRITTSMAAGLRERLSPVADPTTPADRAPLITMTEDYWRLTDGTDNYMRERVPRLEAELDAQRRALFLEREDRRRLEAWSAKWALEWAEVLGGDSLAELRTIVARADVRKAQGS